MWRIWMSSLRPALKAAGNKNYTIRVLPGADHDLEVGDPGNGKITWTEGFLELLTKWTLERMTAKKGD